MKLRRFPFLLACVGVFVALVASAAAGGTPKAGGACSKAGAKVGGGPGITFVCTKKNGKLRWQLLPVHSGGNTGSTSSGTPGGGTSGSCPAGPAVVNDARVCSNGVASAGTNCVATASEGNRIDEAFAIDPSNSSVLYLGVEDLGVYKSTDGGATWNRSSTGLIGYPRKDNPKLPCVNEMGKIVIDPSNPSHLLLARVDSPGTLSDSFSENAGVFESLNAGATWHQSTNNPAINTYVHDGLALGDSNTWYQGTYNSGPSNTSTPGANAPNKVGIINKTSDGGKTWQELPTGLVAWAGVQQLFVKPGDPNTVVAYTIARPILTTPGGQNTFDEGLGTITTVDGGKTWTKIENNLPSADKAPEDIDVAPTAFSHVFWIAFGGGGAGFASADGGRTFTASNGSFLIARYDPHDSAGNTLLGADTSGNVSSSADNGHTWKQISTIPAGSAGSARVSVIRWDPQHAGTVYAGGVYQGSGPRVPFLVRSKDGGVTWQSVLDPAALKP